MTHDLSALLPQGPDDVERARALIDLGYPAVAPVLPTLMAWVQDMRWPVARIIAPFLASLGDEVLPEVHRVLSSNDVVWKYWCLWAIVRELPTPALEELRPVLIRLSRSPSPAEAVQQVDVLAKEIVSRLENHPLP